MPGGATRRLHSKTTGGMSMHARTWVPVLLALTAFGCGAERKLTAPLDAEGGASSRNAAAASAGASSPGAAYTMTNAASGNAVVAFDRSADGTLGASRSYATGGTGSGAGLGNQGALALGDGGRWLFVVNAGSNDVSVFRVGPSGLELTDRVAAGGENPASVTAYHDLVYVLDTGGAGNIQGFRLSTSGMLSPIAGSNRPLSNGAAGGAQIGFTPDGGELVVSEKNTNQLSLYSLASDGSATGPVSRPSSGPTPFGFGFDQNRTLVVSEAFGGGANASAVSSYELGAAGALRVVSGSVPTQQTAACWIAVQRNGRFAYTTNAGSGSITRFALSPEGVLSALPGATPTAAGPSDMAMDEGGRYLYVLSARTQSVLAYAVRSTGDLVAVGSPAATPAGVDGLVVR
jgi:6-phosphogluconolactonase (cycloisomerase 2 family)